ncbi:MAG: endonuclease/exonuclease/phosphatase family protein [Flavobacteriaceae bacterium]
MILFFVSVLLVQGQEDIFKVITYNVWNGFDWGKDGERRAELQKWVASQTPDVVALQELCGYSPERLEEDASTWEHAHSVLLKTSGYSVGLTSRYPITVKERIFEGLHHGALHCTTNGIDFLVVHLHPGSIAKRLDETKILRRKIEAIARQNPYYMVLGDFNAHSPVDSDLYPPDGGLLSHLQKGDMGKGVSGNLVNGDLDYTVMSGFLASQLNDVIQKYTKGIGERGSFPGKILGSVNKESDTHLLSRMERIDFILTSPAITKKSIGGKVYNGAENWYLSDHYPVVAEFKGIQTIRENGKSNTSFADRWEYVGVAVAEPGYTIWGSSPIIGEDGKVHLFVARWPGTTVEPGWRSHSEIAHYVADSPEGPFEFSDVAITGTGKETWDKFGAHNPAIHKVGDTYVLLYIGNTNPKRPDHPANQKIGMALAASPYGPWQKVGKDGLILSPPENEKYWNHKAGNGVNNPAFLQHPDGGFFLYFKSEKARMGLAVAENLEGPYVQMPFPVTANDRNIEDGYAFMYEGDFALLTTDNHGMIEQGGGILWTSSDGIHFKTYEKGFHHIDDYVDFNVSDVTVHYGPSIESRPYSKFERPQVLLKDGKPWYLYVPSGRNIYGGPHTVNYVLKYVGKKTAN